MLKHKLIEIDYENLTNIRVDQALNFNIYDKKIIGFYLENMFISLIKNDIIINSFAEIKHSLSTNPARAENDIRLVHFKEFEFIIHLLSFSSRIKINYNDPYLVSNKTGLMLLDDIINLDHAEYIKSRKDLLKTIKEKLNDESLKEMINTNITMKQVFNISSALKLRKYNTTVAPYFVPALRVVIKKETTRPTVDKRGNFLLF